ncbi:MAG: MFS transporter [Actinomycetota bacterium]|nr:MFS transporter [Actinomycetota bacterium]
MSDGGAPESRLSGDPLAGPPDPPATRGWRETVRGLRLDISPLRTSRDFRLLFLGGSVSFLGSMVTYVAVPFQVYALTGSTALVGLLGLAELVPLIVFGLYGGALADAVDRRRMALLTEAGLALLSALLLLNALLARPLVWPLFAFAAGVAALDALQRPSLAAMLPRLVRPAEIPAAQALWSLRGNLAMVAGPALGGLLVATGGVAAAYAVDAVSFAASLAALALMRAVPAPEHATAVSLSGIVEGFRYAVSRQALVGTYVVDLAAMFFALPTALYPAVAADVLHAPWALGLLYSAGSLGSLAATLTSGWTSRVHAHGRAVALAAGAWGVAIVGFGLAGNVWLAFVFLALAGAADMVSGLFRSVLWDSTIPDEIRGRLAGIELLSYSVGPVLGQARAGGVAAAWSVRGSIVSGGVLCVLAVAALSVRLGDFLAYDDRTDPHALRERRRRKPPTPP